MKKRYAALLCTVSLLFGIALSGFLIYTIYFESAEDGTGAFWESKTLPYYTDEVVPKNLPFSTDHADVKAKNLSAKNDIESGIERACTGRRISYLKYDETIG